LTKPLESKNAAKNIMRNVTNNHPNSYSLFFRQRFKIDGWQYLNIIGTKCL